MKVFQRLFPTPLLQLSHIAWTELTALVELDNFSVMQRFVDTEQTFKKPPVPTCYICNPAQDTIKQTAPCAITMQLVSNIMYSCFCSVTKIRSLIKEQQGRHPEGAV